jgi:hypothetical protein
MNRISDQILDLTCWISDRILKKIYLAKLKRKSIHKKNSKNVFLNKLPYCFDVKNAMF